MMIRGTGKNMKLDSPHHPIPPSLILLVLFMEDCKIEAWDSLSEDHTGTTEVFTLIVQLLLLGVPIPNLQ